MSDDWGNDGWADEGFGDDSSFADREDYNAFLAQQMLDEFEADQQDELDEWRHDRS